MLLDNTNAATSGSGRRQSPAEVEGGRNWVMVAYCSNNWYNFKSLCVTFVVTGCPVQVELMNLRLKPLRQWYCETPDRVLSPYQEWTTWLVMRVVPLGTTWLCGWYHWGLPGWLCGRYHFIVDCLAGYADDTITLRQL